MGKKWDTVSTTSRLTEEEANEESITSEDLHAMEVFHIAWLREAFRILKPGGIAKVFAATRTMHRLAAAMESVGFVLEPDHSIEAWAYGCLSDDTEILTKEGWVHYHKAKVGTEVLGFDLQNGSFTWQVVEETFEYPYDDNAFRIHGDGTDHIVSIGHRCVIENDGQWDFRISQEVPATIVVPVPDGMSVMPQDVHAEVCQVTGLLHEMRQCGLPSGEAEAFVRTENDGSGVYGVREDEVVSECLVAEGDQGTRVLQGVQRGASGCGLGEARAQGCCGGVPGRACIRDCENDGAAQPSVERRGDDVSEARELRQARPDSIPTVPPAVPINGPQGRVCDGTSVDCGSRTGSAFDAIGNRTPQESHPDGQSVGEPGVVCVEPGSQVVRTPWETVASVARVTANVERIHYHGLVWCVRVPTGAFVARRKGMAFVTGNSGFPKSLNLEKSIDAHLGKTEDREVIGMARGVGGENMNDIVAGRDVIRTTDDPGGKGVGAYGTGAKQVAIDIPVTAPASEEAKQFQGFGTSLKPAWEPFVVGRKPA